MISPSSSLTDVHRSEDDQTSAHTHATTQVTKSRNKPLHDLFEMGSASTTLASEGLIKALVCTDRLVWGINLLAHAAIMKVLVEGHCVSRLLLHIPVNHFAAINGMLMLIQL